MSRRYSREEKGKRIEEDRPVRKPLVRVPETDVSELIERNKFTLIGRVTNPAIQKTRALVDFFLQQWHVVGRITGRELGPSLFQFGFESEKDLQTILAKAPFHFKNWMFILQRWEPIVSDSFPAIIPFWVRVHGIPLHYWTDGTIDAIGATLGPIEDREVDKARFRVQVNGLKPLTMKLDLQLPSRKVVEVEEEYEKLGKHCFFCKSLTHEDTEKHPCPLSRAHPGNRTALGITQQNTLERLEDGRRRQEERRYSRQQNLPVHKETRWSNARNASRDSRFSSRDPTSRTSSGRSSGFEENRRRYDDRNLSYRYSTPRETPSQRESQERFATSQRTQTPYRERSVPELPNSKAILASPFKGATSTAHLQTVAGLSMEQRRGSLASRLSDPRSTNLSSDERVPARKRLCDPRSAELPSEERIPAKERLSIHTRRTSGSNIVVSDDNHLREQDNPPAVNSPLNMAIASITRPSSSKIFDSGRTGPCDRSPIRTLSEDRVHVSLRLGPLRTDDGEEDDNVFDLQLQHALSSKAAGKRVAKPTQENKRPVRSPTQEVAPKRRRTTKAKPSPRRKLLLDAITAGGKNHPKRKQRTAPPTSIIPARVGKEKDFHPLQKSLP